MIDPLSKLIVRLTIVGWAAIASVSTLSVDAGSEKLLGELKFNADADLTARELIDKYGYRGETHQVITEDGYILEMHRITGPNSDPSPNGKQPILIMHGIFSSSIDWIITGPKKAFGYILADDGYDVWMGNFRGNTFSRRHKTYSLLDKKYWQFSWHEAGIQDIPAMIDYVLNETSRQQLIYAGHSQGTTSFWVMAMERPEYQNKVKAMFALAPVAHLVYTRSPLYRVLSKFSNGLGGIMELLGWHEFHPPSTLLKEVIRVACDEEAVTQPICINILFLAGGRSDKLNTTMIPAILGHVPAGASVKQVVHYGQVVKARKFQKFDHGLIGNLKKYKKFRPPLYDLSKVKVPVYLHYGSNDWLSHPKDISRLFKELGNPIGKFRVPDEKFGHLDFLWANDVKQLLYDKIMGLMERHRD